MNFADIASQLCGQCAMLLGWRPAEFWTATPAELACILHVMAPQTDIPPDAKEIGRLMQMFPDALSPDALSELNNG